MRRKEDDLDLVPEDRLQQIARPPGVSPTGLSDRPEASGSAGLMSGATFEARQARLCPSGSSTGQVASTILCYVIPRGSRRPVVPLRAAPPDRQGSRVARDHDHRSTPVSATEFADARLVWIGGDDRGIELEIVALDLDDQIVVIHVMPTSLRRTAP